jgi:hypothetical protein
MAATAAQIAAVRDCEVSEVRPVWQNYVSESPSDEFASHSRLPRNAGMQASCQAVEWPQVLEYKSS